jgi:hypothetical protein
MKVQYIKVRDFEDWGCLQKACKFKDKSSFPLFFCQFFLMKKVEDSNMCK